MKSYIFSKDKNKEKEVWDGFIYGSKKASSEFGFDEGLSINKFDEFLTNILSEYKKIFLLQDDVTLRNKISNILIELQKSSRANFLEEKQIHSLNFFADQMRNIKSPDEIKVIKKAADISSEAHISAMTNIRADQNEMQTEARLKFIFGSKGAKNEAYHSIVASGENACTLHYIENNKSLKDGDLILIDAGCEYQYYASDITRTFPINGKFTPPQKDLYALVLEAQKKAIASVVQNRSFNAPHEKAVSILAQGLRDLKILKGSVVEIIENQLYKPFFMHRTSHWMGMDVHDVGNYYDNNSKFVKLQNGQILTIEPGLYFPKNAKIPKSFRGIGIRIEDDILVNGHDPIVLTSKCPKEIHELESLIMSN
jgi:Xaa-Pro aminopeptidase